MIVQTAVDLFGSAYSSSLGYVVVACLVFVDRGAFTGVALPGELFLALGGVYAGRGDLSIVAVIALGAVAGVGGEMLSFWLGRHHGVRIVRRLPFADRFEKHLSEARSYFRQSGGTAIFIGRYVSVVGTFVPFAAGMSGMPFVRFALFDVAAVTLWATGVSLLGYFLNSQIELVDQILSRFGWGLFALVLLLVGGRMAWKRRDRIRRWVRAKSRWASRIRTSR
jgi:membrane-associated protein